ncbi:MAG: hypothetical protein A2132_03750 [Nitrospirae bacterium RBG_16_43_11]|nr:MAG: hypothetical protein A2132_03750 [Nitrospirae bacterium RBG_16_43_11]
MQKSLIFLPIIIALLLTACGAGSSGGNTESGTTSNNESKSISPNGGVVTSSDGKAKIIVPSGALNQSSDITVAAISNQPSGNIGTAYEFGPDGTTFSQPVTIFISYAETSLPFGVSESDIKLGRVTNNQWQAITDSAVDTVANVVSGTTTHLSTYGVMAVSISDTAPSLPSGVTATAGDGQVTISWGAAAGATVYNLYWSTTSGVTKATGTKISNVSSPYIHTGRTNGTTYYYIVTAVNSYGESSESSQVSVTPSATVTPDTTAPSNTTGADFINNGALAANSASVTLSISASDSIGVTTYYASESSTAPSPSTSGWVSVASTTSYSANITFTLSTGDGIKTIYVWFKDAAGNVSASASGTITLDTVPPDTAITSHPDNPTNSASASFSFTATETGSIFQCQMDNEGFAACTSPKSYTGLTDGSHTFYVKATDSSGNTDPIPASFTCTNDTTAPSNPTSITGYSNSAKALSLTSGNWYNNATPYFEWSGASDGTGGSGISGYYVYLGTNAAANPATAGVLQTSAYYSNTVIGNEGTYYLLIKARDAVGNTASGTYTAFTYKYDSSNPNNSTGSNFIDSAAVSTNSTNVTLTLSATDIVGVTGYCEKEASATPSINDICWTSITSTTSYSAGVTFTLSSGDGAKTVYV